MEQKKKSINMKRIGRKLASWLLTIAMVVGLMPGMGLTAYAATDTYTTLMNNVTVVHFHNSDWYIIADDSTSATEGTVTLLSADESFGMSVFNSEANNSYNASAVKAYLDKVVAGNAGEGKPDFSDVADAIVPVDLTTYNFNSTTVVKETTDGAKLYLLDTTTAENLNSTILGDAFLSAKYGGWWLRSPGDTDTDNNYVYVAYVWGGGGDVRGGGYDVKTQFGVRPALKLDLSKVTFDSESNTFSVPTPYPLWVGGTQVTSKNASNIDGDNKASYDDSTHILTLNGYNLTVSNGDSEIEYGIKYTGSDPLTINLEGENAIEGYLKYNRYYDGIDYGIYITRDPADIAADVTFTGEGSLSIKTYSNGIIAFTNTNTNESVGNIVFSGSGEIDVVASGVEAIYTNYGTVTVNSGTVTANGRNGINTQKGVSITGGTVNAIGTTNDYSDSGIGIYTLDELSITGGTVIASGEENGISTGWYGENDTITIDENVISVTISSSGKAISGKLLNKLSGKGWTNVAGTEGETTIEAVNEAREVSETLKKIYFASHEHNFTYTANGATITATCTADGCSLPPTTEGGSDHVAKLTIVAPAKTTYGDSNSAEATTIDQDSIKGSTGINYFTATKSGTSYTKTGSELGSAPTDAGDYWAEITLGTGEGAATAGIGYTIARARESAPAADTTNISVDYLFESISANPGFEVAADDNGTEITDFSSILDNASPTVYICKTASDDNHDPSVWVEVTLSSRPAAPTGLV